jgi:hypothetical protein
MRYQAALCPEPLICSGLSAFAAAVKGEKSGKLQRLWKALVDLFQNLLHCEGFLAIETI